MSVDLQSIRRSLDRAPARVDVPEVSGRAAVAAVVTDDLELLFMRRATYEGDPWSGHVAFPGGRMEDSDPDLLHTAIRETREELGLDLLAHAELLGELDELPTVGHLPPLVIRPYVFHAPRLPRLDPNGEVASVHTLHLERLLANEGRGSMQLDHRGVRRTLPRVDFDGVRLWGLTLFMVDDLLHRLDGMGRGLARLEAVRG